MQIDQSCVNAAYHHFGMISPFKVARDLVRNSSNGSKKFFDEFMTWRELSYAFCFQHWPDLESMQVSLHCPRPYLLAMFIPTESACSACMTHMFSLASAAYIVFQSPRHNACGHLEFAFLSSRHTMCFLLLSQDAALLLPLQVSSQTLQYEALLEHHCSNFPTGPINNPSCDITTLSVGVLL